MSMVIKNLWTIIHAIQRSREITPRQVRNLLGCDSKKACRLLEHLVAASAVNNIGQRRHPVYVMQPGKKHAVNQSLWRARNSASPKFAARTGRALKSTKLSGVREHEMGTTTGASYEAPF
ncbi:hypothetical protein [Enterobacter hormaechei]|uniref:hypothetical protein n=1 Tax=Enterobacter hormaechei TaxID=158836 RepID=UPI0011DD6387|nr:hypothetical protein [Enterobacter hormaechei]